jgi:large subunit ribosomal protein L6
VSRIGKKPIDLPKGIEAKVDGTKLIIKSSKESKELETFGRVQIEVENKQIIFSLTEEQLELNKAFWGTYRALTNNMIIGLTEGFKKELVINGVGYRAAVKGKNLEMELGFSHPIIYEIPAGIKVEVEKSVKIILTGSDKQEIGQMAAEIRAFRPPEPYKGKGVKYADEHIIRKAGKTSKK